MSEPFRHKDLFSGTTTHGDQDHAIRRPIQHKSQPALCGVRACYSGSYFRSTSAYACARCRALLDDERATADAKAVGHALGESAGVTINAWTKLQAVRDALAKIDEGPAGEITAADALFVFPEFKGYEAFTIVPKERFDALKRAAE